MTTTASDHPCVHVIDDQGPIRQTVSFMLASGGFSTRAYSSAADFLQVIDAAPPGCVLTDVRMPGMSGLELARHIERHSERHCVVVMTGYVDVPLVIDAMKSGAVDFLQKPFKRETLISAIATALDRRRIGPAVQPQVAGGVPGSFSSLTARQMDVLRGILAGKLSKIIAHDLGISVRTVEGYRAEIMAKTQCRTVGDLVRTAVLAGL